MLKKCMETKDDTNLVYKHRYQMEEKKGKELRIDVRTIHALSIKYTYCTCMIIKK
jgi:hypothetical protein